MSTFEKSSHQVEDAYWDGIEGHVHTPSLSTFMVIGGVVPTVVIDHKDFCSNDPMALSKYKVSIPFSPFSASVRQKSSLPIAFEELSSLVPTQGREEQRNKLGPIDPASVGHSLWPSRETSNDLGPKGAFRLLSPLYP